MVIGPVSLITPIGSVIIPPFNYSCPDSTISTYALCQAVGFFGSYFFVRLAPKAQAKALDRNLALMGLDERAYKVVGR